MGRARHYVIVVYDASRVRRIMKLLSRFESEGRVRIHAVAFAVYVEDARILGGVKRVDANRVMLLKGVLVPSLKV